VVFFTDRTVVVSCAVSRIWWDEKRRRKRKCKIKANNANLSSEVDLTRKPQISFFSFFSKVGFFFFFFSKVGFSGSSFALG
jgi:hypothetical protein